MSHRILRPFRVFADHGMLLVLALLCVVFSVLTYTEQHPTGVAAAGPLAAQIIRQFGPRATVLIAVGTSADDDAYADKLRADLTAAGVTVREVVKGEPRDARQALKRIADAGGTLDAVAGTRTTAGWLVFQDLGADFPAFGNTRLLTPETYRWPDFLKPDNLLNIANQIAVIAILAIGMTMVIVTGGIDLSVGSLIALSAVLTAWTMREFLGGSSATVAGVALACAVGILACGLVGLFSGFMITAFELPPFIVTLSVMLIASGAPWRLSKGETIDQVPPSFVHLWNGADFLHIPNPVLLMLVLYLFAHVLMSRTRLGRYLYAVGSNPKAARLSGIRVERVLVFAYTCSGLLAGLGGVLFTSKLKSGSASFGAMYELYVIAAVVVGGTSLSGGKGTMFGTLIGAFILAVIDNGMNLLSVDPYTQRIVLGAVLLGAILFDRLKQRSWGRRGNHE